ncbi:hypothetical protein LJB93_03225 [Desulfovibrio sp. OttesenSCG-928-F07]|nr:hypothetical protein [Desulfovibrio sp. OttesenSCG-928-F07]
MSAQTSSHSPEFQAIITQVEAALVQAAEDARLLAERTGTPLVVRDNSDSQTGGYAANNGNSSANVGNASTKAGTVR